MRRATPIVLAAALALGAVAAEGEEASTVDTTHPCYDAETDSIRYDEQQVYFHEGDTKLGTLDEAPHPFDAEPPAASVQAGAGAGQYSGAAVEGGTAGEHYDNVEASFTGTFTGCIDTLLLDMYSFDPTNRTSTSEATAGNPGGLRSHTFRVIVEVDGQEIFRGGPLEANTEWDNEGLGPNLNRYGLELGELIEQYADFGLMAVDGDHTVTVHVAPWFANTGHAVYVWDTTEVPSGLTFNGEITEEYQSPS